MSEHHTVVEYLSGPEELTRKELVWGIVREPAAHTCSHQAVVGRAFIVLAKHVGRHTLASRQGDQSESQILRAVSHRFRWSPESLPVHDASIFTV